MEDGVQKTRKISLSDLAAPGSQATISSALRHAEFASQLSTASLLGSAGLKHLSGIQATLEAIRPMREVSAMMESARLGSQLSAQLDKMRPVFEIGATVKEFGYIARAVREVATISKLFNTSLTLAPHISGVLATIEPIRFATLANSVFDSIRPITELRQTVLKPLPSLASIGATLLEIGKLPPISDINWDTRPPLTLLSAIDIAQDAVEGKHKNSITALVANLQVANDDIAITLPDSETIKAELVEAANTGDVSRLSVGTKSYLRIVLWVITALASYLALQNGFREELCVMQAKIVPGMSSGQIGKAVRKAMCDMSIDMLKGYRFVRGEDVRLRELPSVPGG